MKIMWQEIPGLEDEEDHRPTVMSRLKAATDVIANDPGVREGAVKIVASLAALAIRAMRPITVALVHRKPDDE